MKKPIQPPVPSAPWDRDFSYRTSAFASFSWASGWRNPCSCCCCPVVFETLIMLAGPEKSRFGTATKRSSTIMSVCNRAFPKLRKPYSQKFYSILGVLILELLCYTDTICLSLSPYEAWHVIFVTQSIGLNPLLWDVSILVTTLCRYVRFD